MKTASPAKNPDKSALKSALIGVRLDAETFALLENFEKITHVEKVTLARAALMAALEYWEQHKTLSLPLVVVPSADAEA